MTAAQDIGQLSRKLPEGVFCMSLDFELMWGNKGKWTIEGYGRRVLRVRTVVPRLLEMFTNYGLRATWATVGFIFRGSKDELMAYLPVKRPNYRNRSLSSYRYLDGIGRTEAEDPLHYGASLISLIAGTSGQEIATHTFSHFYALEDGATIDEFDADIDAAKRI